MLNEPIAIIPRYGNAVARCICRQPCLLTGLLFIIEVFSPKKRRIRHVRNCPFCYRILDNLKLETS